MLLDTSGLLCYFDSKETRHNDAVALFNNASQKMTHSYVLAEFVPLCLVRGMNRAATLSFWRTSQIIRWWKLSGWMRRCTAGHRRTWSSAPTSATRSATLSASC